MSTRCRSHQLNAFIKAWWPFQAHLPDCHEPSCARRSITYGVELILRENRGLHAAADCGDTTTHGSGTARQGRARSGVHRQHHRLVDPELPSLKTLRHLLADKRFPYRHVDDIVGAPARSRRAAGGSATCSHGPRLVRAFDDADLAYRQVQDKNSDQVKLNPQHLLLQSSPEPKSQEAFRCLHSHYGTAQARPVVAARSLHAEEYLYARSRSFLTRRSRSMPTL